MRLFTALTLPQAVLDALAAAQGAIEATHAFRRLQSLAQAHLTLNFLGEVAEARLPEVVAALDARVSPARPFTLRLGALGHFGPSQRPRVVYAGLAGDTAALAALQGGLGEALSARGFPLEARSYRPHVTLARDAYAPVDWDALAARVAIAAVDWSVSEVTLFRSELLASGAVHTTLAARRLTGSP